MLDTDAGLKPLFSLTLLEHRFHLQKVAVSHPAWKPRACSVFTRRQLRLHFNSVQCTEEMGPGHILTHMNK